MLLKIFSIDRLKLVAICNLQTSALTARSKLLTLLGVLHFHPIASLSLPEQIVSQLSSRRKAGDIAFSLDSQILAMGMGHYSEDFCLWNIATRQKLRCMYGEHHTVQDLFFTPDDRTVIGATLGGDINFWRTSDRQLLKTIKTQHGILNQNIYECRSSNRDY